MASETRDSWPLVKLTAADQVLADMGDDAPLAAAPGTTPAAYFKQLKDAGFTGEAVTYIAHALPRYECVVWGARSLIETDAVDRRDPLMTAILRWIDSPDDQIRRSIQALAEQEGKSSPVTLLANAVWMSGGSLSDPELPAVLPPTHVCAKLVSGALIKGAYATKAPAAALQRILAIGNEMASGGAKR